MNQQYTAKLVTFGRGSDTVYIAKGHTCSGYGTPENPHAAQPSERMIIPDGTPVIDMRSAVDTTEGFRWVFRTPLVDVDLPDDETTECPIPSVVVETLVKGNEYGGLLGLQKAFKRAEPNTAGPLDCVSAKVYIEGWRNHGARIGTYQNGEIVWEDDRTNCPIINPDGSYTSTQMLFKDLTADEVVEFKKWARENYIVGEPIKEGAWHPVIVAECNLMVKESK